MPNQQHDVLNLSYHEWQDLMHKIIDKTEYAKRLQKAWIGWATLRIYAKLNKVADNNDSMRNLDGMVTATDKYVGSKNER